MPPRIIFATTTFSVRADKFQSKCEAGDNVDKNRKRIVALHTDQLKVVADTAERKCAIDANKYERIERVAFVRCEQSCNILYLVFSHWIYQNSAELMARKQRGINSVNKLLRNAKRISHSQENAAQRCGGGTFRASYAIVFLFSIIIFSPSSWD